MRFAPTRISLHESPSKFLTVPPSPGPGELKIPRVRRANQFDKWSVPFRSPFSKRTPGVALFPRRVPQRKLRPRGEFGAGSLARLPLHGNRSCVDAWPRRAGAYPLLAVLRLLFSKRIAGGSHSWQNCADVSARVLCLAGMKRGWQNRGCGWHTFWVPTDIVPCKLHIYFYIYYNNP